MIIRALTFSVVFCLFFICSVFAQHAGISDTWFTPQSPLHIYRTTEGNLLQLSRSTSVNSGFQIAVQGTNHFQLINREDGHITFHTNNVERVRFVNDGRVYINTITPSGSHRLVVAGHNESVKLLGTGSPTQHGARIDFGSIPGNQGVFISEFDRQRLQINSGTITAGSYTLMTGGNVGIAPVWGTYPPAFIPQSVLHIFRNINTGFLQLSKSASSGTGLIFSVDNDGWVMRNHDMNSITFHAGNSFQRFLTNDLERMRISSDGSVGIATDAPTARLHVHGTVRFSDLPTPSAQTTFLVIDALGNVQARYLPPASLTPPEPAWLLEGNMGTDPTINYLGTSDATDLVIRTSGAERIRVLSTDNVGIGTNNPQRPFHLSGLARITTLAVPAGALVRSDAAGDLSTIAFTGNTNEVLLGDGTWGTVTTNPWEISGNNNTTSGTHYLGTSNAQAFDMRTGNQLRFRIANANQVHAMADGTAAFPFYSWDQNTGMGIYRAGANTLGFSTAGAERFRIPASNQVYAMNDGSAGAPFYSWNSDHNMGMYRIGADVLGFSTNGTERIRIDDAGNVGIGVIPSQRLQVQGNVWFTRSLMPVGNAGTSGQILLSRGDNTAPVWASVQVLKSPSTQRTTISGTTPTDIVGLARTFTITTGAIVLISTYGSLETVSSFSQDDTRALIEVYHTLSGVTTALPGMSQSVDMIENGTYYSQIRPWSMSTVIQLSPGTHTIKVTACKSVAGTSDFRAGGNVTSLPASTEFYEGWLILTIIPQ
jgi:hypothetical protein